MTSLAGMIGGVDSPVAAQTSAPRSLSCPDRQGSLALLGWEIVEGDPEGDVTLAPDRSDRKSNVFTNRWDLGQYRSRPLFLRCNYGNASVDRVVLSLPQDVRGCTATGRAAADGRVALPMTISCR
jgi:hypothetical protein